MSEENVDIRVRLREARKAIADAERIAKGMDHVGDETDEAGRKARRAGRAFAFLTGRMQITRGVSVGVGAGIRTALGGALALTGGLYALGKGTGYAVNAAVDLGEEINKTKVVFRGSEQQILAWSKGTAKALAISRRQALESAGVFGNMLVPMGLARSRAASMSTRMVELAADMASFNNASPEETLAALRSGLAGETEPLRRFGVFLSAARIEQQALSMGLAKGKGKLTEAAKAQAAYALILKDTADAQGDAARTATSLANQKRRLKAYGENIAASVGRLAVPALEKGAGALARFLGQIESGEGKGGRFVARVKGIAGAVSQAARGAKAGIAGGVAPGGQAGTIGLKVGKGLKFAAGVAESAGRQLVEAFAPAVPFFRNVLIPLLTGFGGGVLAGLVGAFHVLTGVIKVVATGLGWLGNKAEPLRGVFVGIGAVLGFVFTGPLLKAITGLGKLGKGLAKVKDLAGKGRGMLGFFGGALTRVGGLVVRMSGVVGRGIGATVRWIGGLPRKAASALRSFAGAVLGPIRGAFTRVLGFVKGLGARFAAAGKALVGALVRGIKSAFANGVGFVSGIGAGLRRFLNDNTILGDRVDLPGPLPSFTMPALAKGGDLTAGGSMLVGEKGPEILTAPKGARVTPLPSDGHLTPALAALGGNGGGDVVVPVYLDGREIARAVAKHTRDRLGRR